MTAALAAVAALLWDLYFVVIPQTGHVLAGHSGAALVPFRPCCYYYLYPIRESVMLTVVMRCFTLCRSMLGGLMLLLLL
ncbi:MAG: hypothetical protein ACK5VU_01495, partial [Burkholderiales bacterium]